jgi:hypothetical protein
MMRRLVLAVGMAVVPLVAAAAPSPAPTAADAARNGGMIDGRVNYVDFQRSMLGVDSPGRGKVDVSVMPTTSIESRDAGYHAFTDIRPGQRVSIMSSLVDGKYVAQIIRIR